MDSELINGSGQRLKGQRPKGRWLFLAAIAVWASTALAQASTFPAELLNQAQAYEFGEGVSQDYTQAAMLYCQGAQAGDAVAQYNLGWMYVNGRGVPRSDDQAVYLFGKAAEQGYEPAKKLLKHIKGSANIVPGCPLGLSTGQSKAQLKPANASQKAIFELVHRLAPTYGVDPYLALAIIKAESNFDPAALSPKNAQGLMQLIPETADRFNVKKPFNVEQNIRGGLAYLKWLSSYFGGDLQRIVAAYNAGEGAVTRHDGVPPYPETKGYVTKVLGLVGIQKNGTRIRRTFFLEHVHAHSPP